MSFLGSIGHVMGGSGLEELLEQIFAGNVIPHIMSGKAYSRALRGHLLVHTALLTLVCEDLLKAGSITKEDLELMATEELPTDEEDQVESVASKIQNAFTLWIDSRSEFETASYWIQYMKYMEVVKQYIRAERTGNWQLHLSGVEKMLNLFAETGHIHYSKSARFYLQQMCDLPKTHPEVYEAFNSLGYHAVRRSDRYWSGLWSDLVIEQVMMRAIKTSGGLTRGRGMTESSRHQWVSTAHNFAGIHDLMTTFTKVKNSSSEQHVDMSDARISRDNADFKKLYDWLAERNPFSKSEKRLKSLSTGITGDSELSCHKAEQIGASIQEKLDNIALSEAKIKRKDSIVGFNDKINSVKVGDKSMAINPTLLFTRLAALAGREDNVEKYFDHELTTYPMSIFKEGLMRKPEKASLRSLVLSRPVSSEGQTVKVVDGGALLHQVAWTIGITYGQLI